MNKEDFEVKALFYNFNNLKFRRYLEIRRKDSTETENDLTVIMMNPGSSKPKDIDEKTDNSIGHLPFFCCTCRWPFAVTRG